MSSSSNTTNVINPKPCNYNCGTRIYWNNQENAYFEVFTKQKHVRPNRMSKSNNNVTQTTTTGATNNKPNYYNNKKKSFYSNKEQSKPKMSNSLELLQGPIADIQRKYEILSDIVSEANGKVHGSQRWRSKDWSIRSVSIL